ncbi:MAG: 3-isopropylmalate dehydratase [Dehalococcoidia bacterium]
MPDVVTGRVWKFGDNINTDLMVPGFTLRFSAKDQLKYLFSANRPGWIDEVQVGDVLIGGKNFGTGSSRPGARSIYNAGIRALVTDGLNGLFLRNSVNFGLPAMQAPGVSEIFEEGDIAEINFSEGTVRNQRTGAVVRGTPLPRMLMDIVDAGGIEELLRKEGYLPPLEAAAAGS